MCAGRAIALLGMCGIAASGCATGAASRVAVPPVAASQPHAVHASSIGGTYIVRSGDTVFGIAFRHHLDYHDLAAWNRLSPDFSIAVGQVLLLHAPSQHAAAAGQAKPIVASALPATLKWVWPTQHNVPPRPVPGGGILLFGSVGQEVRASGAGRVVYVGSGIRGYGNLVILKHGETVLSAYAHNEELLVREGQDVAAGQQIGRMGTGPHQIAALYFEIRLNGKPVDPLKYLPQKQ